MYSKKKAIYFFYLLISISTHASNIVFVHIGNTVPSYLYDAIYQVRLFNPNETLYLLASPKAINNEKLTDLNVVLIDLALLKTFALYSQRSSFDNQMERFFHYASERFIYLNDFMQKYDIQDVIHLESDTLLYTPISNIIDILKRRSEGIAAVFDNDIRCIPSFVYIRNKEYMQQLTDYFIKYAYPTKNDMEVIAIFKKENPKEVCSLPIIMDEYISVHPLRSPSGYQTQNPSDYCKLHKDFNSIFDAAAIGQFLGGADPIHGPSFGVGFINESCLFNPANFEYKWIEDDKGRKVPFAIFNGKLHRINTLHIHSKNLSAFLSR